MDLLKKDDILLTNKYGVLPDPNFSAAKNKKALENSILKSEKRRQEKMRIWNDNLRERAEALASFFKHVDNDKDNNVVKYFGRKELARLRGEDILTQLKANLFNAKT